MSKGLHKTFLSNTKKCENRISINFSLLSRIGTERFKLKLIPLYFQTSGRHSKEVNSVGSSDGEENEANLLLPGLHLCGNNEGV